MGVRSLPGRPSELIRVGLRDLRAVEADPQYRVNMWAWHQMDEQRETCQVCMAGAVLAKTLGRRPTQDLGTPDELGPDTAAKMHALDLFRTGDLVGGLCTLGTENLDIDDETAEEAHEEFHDGVEDYVFPEHGADPEEFHAAMERMADLLESYSL